MSHCLSKAKSDADCLQEAKNAIGSAFPDEENVPTPDNQEAALPRRTYSTSGGSTHTPVVGTLAHSLSFVCTSEQSDCNKINL